MNIYYFSQEMNGMTFNFTASSFPAQVTNTKSSNTLAMNG